MAKKLLCYLRFHRWEWVHVPDGEPYEACIHCGKEKAELLGRTGVIG